jgi:hypothetical protein
MTLHELFEQHFADQHDCHPEHIREHRLSNDSYAKADIATAFRNFRAGYKAKQIEALESELICPKTHQDDQVSCGV